MTLIGREKCILDFVKGKQEIKDQEKLDCKIQAAELLKTCNFGEDYLSVALCHDLMGKKDVSEEVLLELVGTEAFKAIKIIDARQDPNLGTKQYLEMVKGNEIANAAMTATLACTLNMAVNATNDVRDLLIFKSEKYYLKFVEGTPGYLFVKEGYDALKASNQINQPDLINQVDQINQPIQLETV